MTRNVDTHYFLFEVELFNFIEWLNRVHSWSGHLTSGCCSEETHLRAQGFLLHLGCKPGSLFSEVDISFSGIYVVPSMVFGKAIEGA